MTSASVTAVVTVLCRVDDCFATQLRLVLVKIQPSLTLVKCQNSPRTETLYVSLGTALITPLSFVCRFTSCLGHVCKNVLLSGFEARVSTRERADAVEEAVSTTTLLADKSHWGVIRVKGEDRLRFLHSQGTNSFERADKGEDIFTGLKCEKRFAVRRGPTLCARVFFIKATVRGGSLLGPSFFATSRGQSRE